jgi:hypothetical protein
MKALSLLQPWASLVTIGAKKIETRSWQTKYRGPLAIHAAKNFPREARQLCLEEPFLTALTSAGLQGTNELPCGAVVATCNLVDCLEIGAEYMSKWGSEIEYPLPTGNELTFGDYTPGRFAWILRDIKQLSEPIPARGQQGLWNWEVPEGVFDNG